MSDPTETRVGVLGAGAVGAHIGALLQLGGVDVTLIGRPRVLEPMRDGVTIRLPDGHTIYSQPVVWMEETPTGCFNVVLLTVKAYSVASTLDDIDRLLAPGGAIVAFQNGVGSDAALLDRFGSERLIAATSTISVGIDEPGVVSQYTNGGLAWSGYGTGRDAASISSLFVASRLPVATPQNPASLRWSKLLLNAVGSAQCAILGTNLDRIVADPRLFAVEVAAFRERIAVAESAGIDIVDLPGYRVKMAARVVGLPPWFAQVLLGPRMSRGRGGKSPTLRGDAAKGGPTENAFLNWSTVTAGKEHGVATPVNEVLSSLVDEVTDSAERRAQFVGNPTLLLSELGRVSNS